MIHLQLICLIILYTRPESIDGESVPDVLLSGNQAKIDAWRREQAIKKTKQKRPDILSR